MYGHGVRLRTAGTVVATQCARISPLQLEVAKSVGFDGPHTSSARTHVNGDLATIEHADASKGPFATGGRGCTAQLLAPSD